MNRHHPNAPKARSFYQRWSGAILLLTLVVTPFAFYGAGKAIQSNVNKVEDWLPKTFVETEQLAWFRKHFAEDQFIFISWEGCLLADSNQSDSQDDPRIERLARLLVPDVSESDGAIGLDRDESVTPELRAARSKYFKAVRTGRRLLDQMTENKLAPEDAIKRLQGSMIGPDGRQTCVVVTLKSEALTELKYVLGQGQFRLFRPNVPPGALRRLIEQAGISKVDLRMGGPPVDNVAIDEEGARTLVRLAGLSGILGLFLAWWSLRSIMLTMVVFASGVLSAATSLAFIWVTGQNLDAIVMSMPSLVYVLAISGAVHLINYYRDAVRTGGLSHAVERAVLHAYKPAVLCTITTAIGLLSLLASDLMPIRNFGFYSACGVVILAVVVYVYLPAALQFTNYGAVWLRQASHDTKNASSRHVISAPSFFERLWGRIGSWIVQHHAMVSIGCIVFIGVVALGLRHTRPNIDLLKLFDSKARILQDYAWFEKKLGMLVPLEIVVRFSPEVQLTDAIRTGITDSSKLSKLERMETIQRMQNAIADRFGIDDGTGIVGKSMSAVTFVPDLPSGSGSLLNLSQRNAFNSVLVADSEKLSDFVKVDSRDGNELWRISLRVAAFKDVNYGHFVTDLKEVAQPVLDAHQVRVKVLNELSRWTNTESPTNAKVALWNYRASESDFDSDETKAESHDVLSENLDALLKQAKCLVRSVPKHFHPQSPLSQLKNLARFDAVVVMGDFSDADLQLIRSEVPHLIDGRVKQAGKDSSLTSMAAIDAVRPPIDAVYTGVIPIVYKAQESLLASLVQSTWWSFLSITPIMMLVSRSFAAGAVVMLPNILPVVVVFGGMGWLDIPIDIGSMMTASIALGVAVDDTIHFLAHYREVLDHAPDRNSAIVASYQHCAIPTLQAAVISGLGLSVFAFSTFTPTQKFGWLMLTILMAGVVSELVLLPALLAGPLGVVFKKRHLAVTLEEASPVTNETSKVCAA